MEWIDAKPLAFISLAFVAGIASAIVHNMRKQEDGIEKKRMQFISAGLLIFSLFSFVILYYINLFWTLDWVFFAVSVFYFTMAILNFRGARDWLRTCAMLVIPIISTIYIGIPNVLSILIVIILIVFDLETSKSV